MNWYLNKGKLMFGPKWHRSESILQRLVTSPPKSLSWSDILVVISSNSSRPLHWSRAVRIHNYVLFISDSVIELVTNSRVHLYLFLNSDIYHSIPLPLCPIWNHGYTYLQNFVWHAPPLSFLYSLSLTIGNTIYANHSLLWCHTTGCNENNIISYSRLWHLSSIITQALHESISGTRLLINRANNIGTKLSPWHSPAATNQSARRPLTHTQMLMLLCIVLTMLWNLPCIPLHITLYHRHSWLMSSNALEKSIKHTKLLGDFPFSDYYVVWWLLYTIIPKRIWTFEIHSSQKMKLDSVYLVRWLFRMLLNMFWYC